MSRRDRGAIGSKGAGETSSWPRLGLDQSGPLPAVAKESERSTTSCPSRPATMLQQVRHGPGKRRLNHSLTAVSRAGAWVARTSPRFVHQPRRDARRCSGSWVTEDTIHLVISQGCHSYPCSIMLLGPGSVSHGKSQEACARRSSAELMGLS